MIIYLVEVNGDTKLLLACCLLLDFEIIYLGLGFGHTKVLAFSYSALG